MSNDTASSGDVGLPADVWIEVALDSEPLDVISLSQTCKLLHLLLSEKSVWKAILRDVMRGTGPFIVSYSPDDLTIDGLKRAATRPDRWTRFTVRECSPTLWTAGSPVKDPKLARDLTEALTSHKGGEFYRLIPGGRFLLYAKARLQTGDPRGPAIAELTLWDLGHHSYFPSVNPVRVASHSIANGSFPPHQLRDLRIDLCLCGTAQLRVVASFTRTESGVCSAIVLGLSLDSPECHFAIISSIEYTGQAYRDPLISGDHVLLPNLNGILLWNYNKRCTYRWSDPTPRSVSNEVVWIMEGYVVGIISGSMVIWDISRMVMSKETHINDSPPPLVQPHLYLEVPWPKPRMLEHLEYTQLRQVSSTVDDQQSVLFDVVTYNRYYEGSACLKVYRCCLALEKHSDVVEGSLILQGAGHLMDHNFKIFERSRLGGFCLNRVGTGNSQFYCYRPVEKWFPNPLEPLDAPNDFAAEIPLPLVPLGAGYPLAACLLSGRVIYYYRRPDQPQGPDDIMCADYLT